ncbi:MAG TPA: hypothetical protein VHU40_21045 [Polyangia bacterium]|nr:hypothetical protein [Polyangia bacterium]
MSKQTEPGIVKRINQADTEEIGEGNQAADRRYRKATETFIAEGKVDAAAREAQRAVEDEGERRELERAEEKGRAPARKIPEDVSHTRSPRH